MKISINEVYDKIIAIYPEEGITLFCERTNTTVTVECLFSEPGYDIHYEVGTHEYKTVCYSPADAMMYAMAALGLRYPLLPDYSQEDVGDGWSEAGWTIWITSNVKVFRSYSPPHYTLTVYDDMGDIVPEAYEQFYPTLFFMLQQRVYKWAKVHIIEEGEKI